MESYGFAEFAAQVLEIGQGALSYVAAGVTAGVVVFAVVFGIRKGVGALRALAADKEFDAYLNSEDSWDTMTRDERDAWNAENLDPEDPEDWR